MGVFGQDIAANLTLSERSIGNHVGNILDKLGLANRTQAALCALRQGLTSLEVDKDGSQTERLHRPCHLPCLRCPQAPPRSAIHVGLVSCPARPAPEAGAGRDDQPRSCVLRMHYRPHDTRSSTQPRDE